MNKKNILHLTDMHINNMSVNSIEFLRDDFFETYVVDLCKEIKKSVGQIDCIVATGDFVDRGKTENFVQAKKILNLFLSELELDKRNLGVCIGNHDIKAVYKNDVLQPEEDDRSAFYDFQQTVLGETITNHPENFYYISEISGNTYYIGIDSTLGRKNDQPGKLPNAVVNQLDADIRQYQLDHPNNLIIIGVHYPLTYFDDSLFPDEEGWYDKHFWRSGSVLQFRLRRTLGQSQTLWLFGDTHESGKRHDQKQLFVMSGRIGTKLSIDTSPKDQTQLKRQARVISYSENNQVTVHTFEFTQNNHEENLHLGHWTPTQKLPIDYKIDSAEVIPGKNSPLEVSIIKIIKQKKLYRFDRFPVGEDQVSLGWVSVNKLLSDRNGILEGILLASREWISSKIGKTKDANWSDILLIGLDFWGSILSSQLSIMTGARNYCKASKGSDNFYSNRELFDNKIPSEFLLGIKHIVLITDVVSSGDSIQGVADKIRNQLEQPSKSEMKWHAISVISDRHQSKKADLSFLTSFGTFCSNLRIPVVSNSFLPDEDLFPPQERGF